MRTIRLGDLLVAHGVLTVAEKETILIAQQQNGGAFGALAEELFGVSPAAVERAWAEQYASYAPSIDPRQIDPDDEVLGLISKRQAWQFRLLPVGFKDEELVVCTSENNLPRALKFAGWKLGHRCEFVLARPRHLGEALVRLYPLGGMSPEMVEGEGVYLR